MRLYDFGERTGHKAPKANIGAMRLPKDVDDAVSLIRRAIDRGMRYIDASRGYEESEWLVGLALKDGYREKALLSTKWAPWTMMIKPDDAPTSDCVRRRIEESMKRLGVDRLDYYQVWGINSPEHHQQAIAKGGMVEGMLRAKEEGLIGHLGFTSHDTPENIIKYVEQDDWCDVILMSYNLLNTRYAPAIKAAHDKGMGVIVMNPIGGGRLAEPSSVLASVAKEVAAASVPDMSVRYVLSNPHIDAMLIGITKLADVDDSIASVQRGGFSEAQLEQIERAFAGLKKKAQSSCTGCGYCMPCPSGINIPAVISCVLDIQLWGWEVSARQRYAAIRGRKADACTQCGKCEKACTQGISIIENMAYAREHLAAMPDGAQTSRATE